MLDLEKAAIYGRAFLMQCLGAARASLQNFFELLSSLYIYIYHQVPAPLQCVRCIFKKRIIFDLF